MKAGLRAATVVVGALSLAPFAFALYRLGGEFLSIEALTLPAAVGVGVVVCRRHRLESAPHPRAFVPPVIAAVLVFALAFSLPWLALACAPACGLIWVVSLRGRSAVAQLWPLLVVAAMPALMTMGARPRFDLFCQQWSARAAVELLGLFDIETRAHRTTIRGLQIPVYVTRRCAGAHVVAGAIISAGLTVAIVLRSQIARASVLVAFLALTVIGNVVRIGVIAATVFVSGAPAARSWHDPIGWIVVAVAHILLLGAVVVLARMERKRCVTVRRSDALALRMAGPEICRSK